jgi:cystathionine gamma-synthase
MNGQGDALGGVVYGRKDFIEETYHYRETVGSSLDARAAYMLLRSLKTPGLRVQRQNESAQDLPCFLDGQVNVKRGCYPDLQGDHSHEIAKTQMRGFGGVLSFGLGGGIEAVLRFLPRLRWAYMAANLCQVETIVVPPSLTNHVEVTAEE